MMLFRLRRNFIMSRRYCIAGDVGGSNIRVSLVDSELRVISKLKEPTGAEPLEVLFRLINSLFAATPDNTPVCGIGLAVAGIVESTSGTVLRSPNIKDFSGLALGEEVRKRYSVSVVIENDANAAAYGEKVAGAGAEFGNFVMLTLGTGIGGGLVVNNKLLPVAAELGHTTVNTSGPQCGCGNLGCLESYASATAIIGSAVSAIEKGASSILRDSFQGNFYKISAEDIYKAALEGDPLARSVLRDAGKALGIGIANLINIMSPEAVILTGGLLGAWNIYIDVAIAEASKRAFPELFSKVRIIPSSLGDDAGTLGIAALVFEKGEEDKKNI
jgi:glucokinase